MTEQEFLAALPPPGEPWATLALDNLADAVRARSYIALRLVEGGTDSTFRGGQLHHVFKGRLTYNGELRLAEITEGLEA